MQPIVLVLLLILQGFQFEQPVDDVHTLRVEQVRDADRRPLRISLVNRSNSAQSWELVTLNDFYGNPSVDRVDGSSVVLSSTSDYGVHQGSTKLFFSTASRTLLGRIDFDPSTAMREVGEAEARRAGIVPTLLERLRTAEAFSPHSARTPEPFAGYPLPQSTYAEFARARAERVRNGYVERSTTIEESIGPYQIVGERVWFGKMFYDGEGVTGIGGIGYLDTVRREYYGLDIPEMLGWSASALLIEDQTVWVGRVRHPEGADYPGGLLRHDLRTGMTRLYPMDDVIRSIMRSEALYLGTTNGIYVLDDRLIRHRAEPDIDGRFILVSEEP